MIVTSSPTHSRILLAVAMPSICGIFQSRITANSRGRSCAAPRSVPRLPCRSGPIRPLCRSPEGLQRCFRSRSCHRPRPVPADRAVLFLFLLVLLKLQIDRDRDLRSLVGSAFDLNVTIHQVDDVSCNGHTKTGALHLGRPVIVCPAERLEHDLLEFRRHTDAVVLDGNS